MAFSAVATIGLKVAFVLWHIPYDLCWRVMEPVGVILAGAVTLRACRHFRPVYAPPALILHAWAARYPERWPGSWLAGEMALLAFLWMVLGMHVLMARKWPLALYFLASAIGLYAGPWHADLRVPVMYVQSVAVASIAFSLGG